MTVDQAYNFRKITDRVSTSGLLSEKQLQSLGPEGYQVVINLLPDDSEYAILGEAELVQHQGLAYHAIPVNFAAPMAEDYRAFVRLMEESEGDKVLIHCAANYRVSAFFAMYACEYLGWSADQANALFEDIWNPHDHPVWLSFISRVLTVR